MINPIFLILAIICIFAFLASFLGKRATILIMATVCLLGYILYSGLGF